MVVCPPEFYSSLIKFFQASLTAFKSLTPFKPKMNFNPSISDIAYRRAYFSKDPADLVLDKPKRTVQDCLDFFSDRMLRALFQFNAASAARQAAEAAFNAQPWEVAWDEMSAETQDHLNNLAIASQRARAKEEAAEEKFMGIRARFFDEIAYALHYDEVMKKLARDLAGMAAPALRHLPKQLPLNDLLRIASALGRKARQIKEAGLKASPRRLLRGLPLVVVGV